MSGLLCNYLVLWLPGDACVRRSSKNGPHLIIHTLNTHKLKSLPMYSALVTFCLRRRRHCVRAPLLTLIQTHTLVKWKESSLSHAFYYDPRTYHYQLRLCSGASRITQRVSMDFLARWGVAYITATSRPLRAFISRLLRVVQLKPKLHPENSKINIQKSSFTNDLEQAKKI